MMNTFPLDGETVTAKNTVISPDCLVWKFCGKAQRKLCGNCAFPQNFHTRKSGEIMVFFAVCFDSQKYLTKWVKLFFASQKSVFTRNNEIFFKMWLTIMVSTSKKL